MNSNFFSANRSRILSSLKADLIVITAYTKQQNTGDTAHVFRQESNFWYLCGIEYPDWRLIIDGRQNKSWLVAPEVDPTHQLFDGSLEYEAARKISGVDEVISSREGRSLLLALSKKYKAVYTPAVPSYAQHADFVLNPAPALLRKELKKLFAEVGDCQVELAAQRAIKQPLEIEAIRNATDITVGALKNIYSKLDSVKYEFEIEAELIYDYRRQNAQHAFEPIVANGKNACTLHYSSNSSQIKNGALLLIDTGARKESYSADITRTFAVGALTSRQQAVHSSVKMALQEIGKLLKPGISTKDYIEASDAIMKDALVSLGLMESHKDSKSYRAYFPHAISHGLGLDVHEGLGGYKEFFPGMVVTVEPGMYIPEEEIGVRIEDNFLITDQGSENLTAALSTDSQNSGIL